MNGRNGHRGVARRWIFATVGSILLVGTLIGPEVALGREPSGQASCTGIELAAISPPGSSDEEPGGAPQFVGEVRALASELGAPAGALFSFIASLHAGSHDLCDAALG